MTTFDKKILSYLIILALMAAGILFSCRAHACEYRPNARIEIAHFYMSRKLSAADRKHFQDKARFHEENGARTYREAKDKCWYLPDVDDRSKARSCFMAAVATVGCSTPQAKLVAAVSTLLLNYGLDMISEWEYIENKLYWSAYHFEMCDFYYELLKTK